MFCKLTYHNSSKKRWLKHMSLVIVTKARFFFIRIISAIILSVTELMDVNTVPIITGPLSPSTIFGCNTEKKTSIATEQ